MSEIKRALIKFRFVLWWWLRLQHRKWCSGERERERERGSRQQRFSFAFEREREREYFSFCFVGWLFSFTWLWLRGSKSKHHLGLFRLWEVYETFQNSELWATYTTRSTSYNTRILFANADFQTCWWIDAEVFFAFNSWPHARSPYSPAYFELWICIIFNQKVVLCYAQVDCNFHLYCAKSNSISTFYCLLLWIVIKINFKKINS